MVLKIHSTEILKMVSLNRIILAGNLTNNPVIETLQNGITSCKFNLAINDTWKDSNGEIQTKNTPVSLVAQGNLAKNCHEHLVKDLAVMVEGKIEVENGNTKIVANNIVFLENK